MTIKPKLEIQEIKPYPLGKTLDDIQEEYKPIKLRKLSDNENVYGCSPLVVEELRHSLDSLSVYPDGTNEKLREQLSLKYQLGKDFFLIGNGSEELIRLIARAFISNGDEALMADVTFPIYKSNVVIEGGTPVFVPLKEGSYDLDGFLNAITENTKMIFICNPNNPTGTWVNPKELKEFIEKIPKHILIVLDEAYDEYMEIQHKLDSVSLVESYSNLVLLRTFSKIYGLASLRIGYGIMMPNLIEQIVKVKEVFNVNQLAQNAAVAALMDQAFIENCKDKNQIEKEFLSNWLSENHILFFPSQTNFVFLYNLGNPEKLNEELLKQGLVVRFFPFPQYNGSMRYTLGNREDQEDLIKVLEKFFDKKEVANHGITTSLSSLE